VGSDKKLYDLTAKNKDKTRMLDNYLSRVPTINIITQKHQVQSNKNALK